MDNTDNYNLSVSVNDMGFSQSSFSKETDGIVYNFDGSMLAKDVFSLAKAFLSIDSMTHKKLQKLCYYAKAWYLALYDENLISEGFQAWVHGAVQPVLYQQYKQYGFDIIPKCTNVSDVPEQFLSFANEIFDAYGHMTGDQLEKLNHSEPPWINARQGYEPWEKCENYISENDMKEYYRKLM